MQQISGTETGCCPTTVDAAQAERLRSIVLGLTRLLNQVDRYESACCGVTVGQCLTLTTLREQGAVTSQQLGQMLGLAPSTVTRAIAPLHERGWIDRRRDETDRRQLQLSLTPEGTVLAEQLATRATATYGHILERVPEELRDSTLAGLEVLLDACRDAQAICCPPMTNAQPEAHSAAMETVNA